MPLFDDLQYFSVIFAPNYVTFDPWVWHKKRSDSISSFPLRVLVLSYAPLKFSKEKSLLWLLLQNCLMEFLEIK